MIEHEQEDFRSKEKVVTNETSGVSGSDVGHCEDKAESTHSSAAETVETTEAERKVALFKNGVLNY